MDSWSVPESETHLHQDALITIMLMLGTEASLIGASAHAKHPIGISSLAKGCPPMQAHAIGQKSASGKYGCHSRDNRKQSGTLLSSFEHQVGRVLRGLVLRHRKSKSAQVKIGK